MQKESSAGFEASQNHHRPLRVGKDLRAPFPAVHGDTAAHSGDRAAPTLMQTPHLDLLNPMSFPWAHSPDPSAVSLHPSAQCHLQSAEGSAPLPMSPMEIRKSFTPAPTPGTPLSTQLHPHMEPLSPAFCTQFFTHQTAVLFQQHFQLCNICTSHWDA